MGVEIPNGFGQATFAYTCMGVQEEMVWTLGIAPTGILIPATGAEDIYDSFTATTRPGHAAQFTGTWTFQGVDLTIMTGSGPILHQHRVPIVGTKAGISPPPNCCLLFKKNTALGGRKNRGRIFLPPCNVITGDISAAGLLATNTGNSLQTMFTTFLVAMEQNGMLPVLLHSSVADAPTPITSFSVGTTIATQRRRLR